MADGLRLNNDRGSLGTNLGLSFGAPITDGDYNPKAAFHFRSEPARNSGSVVLSHKPIGGLPQFNRFAPTYNTSNGFQVAGGYEPSGGGGSSSSDSEGLSTGGWVAIIAGTAVLGLIVYGLATMKNGNGGDDLCLERGGKYCSM